MSTRVTRMVEDSRRLQSLLAHSDQVFFFQCGPKLPQIAQIEALKVGRSCRLQRHPLLLLLPTILSKLLKPGLEETTSILMATPDSGWAVACKILEIDLLILPPDSFVLTPGVLFFIFSAPWLWYNISPAIPIIFAYVFYICMSSFIHASVSDPGVSDPTASIGKF